MSGIFSSINIKAVIEKSVTAMLQRLGVAGGAALVGYKGGTVGAELDAINAALANSTPVQSLGGADDWNGEAGTNNFDIFEALCAAKPVVIRLPRTKTGVYMLNGNTALANMDGVVFDPDEGVSLYIKGIGKPQAGLPGVKATRAMNVYYEAGRYSRPLGPRMFEKPSEKTNFLSPRDGELHKAIAIDFTADAFNAKLSAWPNGVLVRYVPTAVAVDSVTHPIAAGLFAGTLVNVVPGDQIFAEVSTESHFPSVMIETDSGWMVAWASIGGSDITTMELVAGVGVNLTSKHPVLANASYNLDKCMLGICIYDEQSFGLMVNGIVIKRFNTDGKIRAAGWSGGFNTAPFYVSNGVMFKNKRTAGVKPLKLICVGDSTSARGVTLESQYEFAAQYLRGMGGCQIQTLTNIAVAGNTSAQQLAALQGTNVAGYDYGLIQIGVNDIQTGATAAVLAANVESMVAYLRASNVIPIVGLPTMWYSKAAAQAFGQDGAPTNESNTVGGHYRLILLRKLAALGVYVNTMVLEDEGAVVASLLSLPGGDSVVLDNIHPTVYGAMLMGYSWAKAIAAHLVNAATDTPVATKMAREWFAGGAGASSTPSYTVSGGVISVHWYLSRNGVAWNDGDVIGTLPARLRPVGELIVPAVCVNATTIPLVGATYLKITEKGQIKIYGAVDGAIYVSMVANWRI